MPAFPLAPETGQAIALEPLVVRVLAPNPSPYTHTGTQCHIVGARDLAVIDPGPDHPDHLAALLRAIGERNDVLTYLGDYCRRRIGRALTPAARARMQAAVLAELERLSDSADDCGTAALRCGPDDAALLQDWLGRPGCAIALDPTGAPGTVDLAIRGGRVCFDHAAVTQGFRDLFRDFMDGLTE